MTVQGKGFDTDTELTEAVVAAAKAGGITGIGRYLKNLTAAEVALCAEYGIGLWLIAEGMGDLATMEQGKPRGQVDGAAAKALARKLGVPPSVTIFAAVDFDAASSREIAAVDAYMVGFDLGCEPYPPGVYGDGAVITSLPGWRAYIAGADGWEGTAAVLADPSHDVALIQHAETTMFGISVDPVDILDPSVLWLPGGWAVPPNSEPAPPAPSGVPSARQMQKWLNAEGAGLTEDGRWGPRSAAALANYYATHS